MSAVAAPAEEDKTPRAPSKPKIKDLSQEMREKKELPPMHHAFYLEMKDPDSDRMLTGTFMARRLNVAQIRQLALIKAELNGGHAEGVLDRSVALLNHMLAHLRVALVSAPDWWKPDEFWSGDVITHVFDEVMSFEDRFRETPPGGNA